MSKQVGEIFMNAKTVEIIMCAMAIGAFEQINSWIVKRREYETDAELRPSGGEETEAVMTGQAAN